MTSWGRNRLQRFIGPKIRALFGLGRTDPRIKINPPSNKARASIDQVCFAICVKFISLAAGACMIARAVIWLNLKEKNEYSFYGNA
ncbi:hypothetical protein CAMGR0001_2611 [Campylobacter gracilis RM3268]|uniref:Uncharacterized protein n=1 Tax=Campylobacter gracilis RM3268 TaxID=553220 RepID=C8PEX2_9BACT|nr:hypothetical protein CAMGR0001_2611 [Campylobacter gracilis RM3268]